MIDTKTALPTDSQARKDMPMATGLLDYFPAALAEIARLSKAGNDKHNPGQELHHSRGKSGDHADTIMRHLAERGIVDTDGFYHDVKVAWRALAMLQELLEQKEGAPLPRAARLPGMDRVPVKEDRSPMPLPPYTRSEIAYFVARQLKDEGYDLNTAIDGARSKELQELYTRISDDEVARLNRDS